jgi:hypothetical protein
LIPDQQDLEGQVSLGFRSLGYTAQGSDILVAIQRRFVSWKNMPFNDGK